MFSFEKLEIIFETWMILEELLVSSATHWKEHVTVITSAFYKRAKEQKQILSWCC